MYVPFPLSVKQLSYIMRAGDVGICGKFMGWGMGQLETPLREVRRQQKGTAVQVVVDTGGGEGVR